MTSLNSEEKTVLSLIAQGCQNEDIADVMCKSPHTIKNHKTNITINSNNIQGKMIRMTCKRKMGNKTKAERNKKKYQQSKKKKNDSHSRVTKLAKWER